MTESTCVTNPSRFTGTRLNRRTFEYDLAAPEGYRAQFARGDSPSDEPGLPRRE